MRSTLSQSVHVVAVLALVLPCTLLAIGPNQPVSLPDVELSDLVPIRTADPVAVPGESAAPSVGEPPVPDPDRAGTPPKKLFPGSAGNRSAPAPRPSSGLDSSWILHTLVALGLVIGLIFLLRAGLSRVHVRGNGRAESPVLEVLSRVRIAPRSQVLLIRLGHRVLVVGESASGLNTLADVEDAEEVATLLRAVAVDRGRAMGSGFKSLLRRFHREYEPGSHLDDGGGDHEEYQLDRTRDQISTLLSRVRHRSREGEAR